MPLNSRVIGVRLMTYHTYVSAILQIWQGGSGFCYWKCYILLIKLTNQPLFGQLDGVYNFLFMQVIKSWNTGIGPGYHYYLTDVKGARSYSSKLSFLSHLKNHHSKDVNSKFELKRSKCLDVRSIKQFWDLRAVAYIWLCKLDYGYHNRARFH